MIASQGFAEKISALTEVSRILTAGDCAFAASLISERCPFEPFGKGSRAVDGFVPCFVHMSDKIPTVFERNYFRRWLKIIENLQNRR
jgi:hypothetical protein